ncbi:MAG: hypothetical protein ABEI86_11825 [Halobacteriaceae archaeon]
MPKYYPETEPEERQKQGYPGLVGVDVNDANLRDGHELFRDFSAHLRFREEDIRSCMEKVRGKSSMI